MRQRTYARLEGHAGYIGTEQLLKAGVTNRQIAALTEEGLLERICHGHYWIRSAGCEKPKEYKAVEVCLSDPNAVICADSACFYHGLIDQEPPALSVATKRNDRRKIEMNFPVARHYYSENRHMAKIDQVSTQFGTYSMFDLEKSVCDCIYFRKDIDEKIFECIMERYSCYKERQMERLMEYAKRLCVLKELKKYL